MRPIEESDLEDLNETLVCMFRASRRAGGGGGAALAGRQGGVGADRRRQLGAR